MSDRLEVIAIAGVGEVEVGANLAGLLAGAAARNGEELKGGDVLVVSHKVVSKAEGRLVELGDVEPGERARELGASLDKDPRLVELVLRESRAVLRAERGRLIVETRSGWVCANAGIDASNVPGNQTVALLPEDADASARRVRASLRARGAGALAVVVADSFGRAWRLGQADVAIGCAGLRPLDDWVGRADAHGRPLAATRMAIADEVASAADLVRPKDAGSPAAIVRGLASHVTDEDGPGAAQLRRAESEDLFR